MRNGKDYIFWLLLIACVLPATSRKALAAEHRDIIVTDELSYAFICHAADAVTDNRELFTIEDVSAPDFSESFGPMQSNGFIPRNARVTWLRFTVENTTTSHFEWFVEYDYFKSQLELELYIPTGNHTFQVKRAYPGIPKNELDLPYRNYLFRLLLPPGSRQTYYLKATVTSDLYLVLKIWHPDAFFSAVRTEQLLIGIFLGIMCIMAFYNFFLFLSFKDKSYIYYILLILSLSILQLNNHSIIPEWFPVLRQYDALLSTIFKLLSFLSFLFFSRSFLLMKKYFPKVDRLLTIFIYTVTATGLLSFSFGLFKPINSILLGLSGILVLILAIMILIKGNRIALYFLIAMAALVACGILVLIPSEKYYIQALDSFVPFYIDIGSLLMIVLFSFGLAYRIRILQQEQEHLDRLKELDMIKSRFFSMISHEFRTPLTLIMGPLDELLAECKQPAQQKKLDLMQRNPERLLSLIDQLLILSRLESGKMVLQVSQQNLISFLKGIIACFEYLAEQNQQHLIFKSTAEQIAVYFDFEKMEKVWLNLLSNALKFTPPGGHITVEAVNRNSRATTKQFPAGLVEVSVTNTGIGIPPEQRDYIFEHFYQAGNSKNTKLRGFGLGLALVKEYIKLHHGTLEVKSSAGEPGEQPFTSFHVRLPLGRELFQSEEIAAVVSEKPESVITPYMRASCANADPGQTAPPIPSRNVQQDPQQNVILVMEDDQDVRNYLAGGLQKEYTVVEAVNGEEGLRKARQVISDLILSDVMMPGMDGYELCLAIKKQLDTSHIPVILLTAKVSEQHMLRGLECGADDYISKPFTLHLVLARIKNLIALRCRLQEKIQRQLLLQPAESDITSVDKEFIQRLNDVIENKIQDQNFSIETLASELYLSKATLNRKIRALTGNSTNQYIQMYRLQKAARLLRSKFGNVTDVCYQVGFSSSAYFTKCFKEAFHQLPSHFQAAESS